MGPRLEVLLHLKPPRMVFDHHSARCSVGKGEASCPYDVIGNFIGTGFHFEPDDNMIVKMMMMMTSRGALQQNTGRGQCGAWYSPHTKVSALLEVSEEQCRRKIHTGFLISRSQELSQAPTFPYS